MKNGKASEDDSIRLEMLKVLGEKGIIFLRDLFQKIWNAGYVPKDWEKGIVTPIFKKRSRECQNYRGVTLLSVVAKAYERVLEDKLKKLIKLMDSQSGFRRGYSIQDHIFTIKQIIDKIREQGLEAYVAFIDLEKAFDRIPRNTIWKTLEKRRVGKRLTTAIKSTYSTCRNIVRIRSIRTQEFNTEQGWRHGSVLSPTLFILIMDEVIREVRAKVKKLHIGFRNLNQVDITECAFADDLAIFARNEKELQQNIEIWKDALGKRDMKINEEKTKIMVISSRERSVDIKLNGKTIEQVQDFKYLGSALDSEGKQEIELTERMKAAAKIYGALNRNFISRKEITKQTKIKVYKSIYRPTLIFGSESWALTRSQKSRVQAMEMKYLRRTNGVTRRDRIRNQDIRKELQVEPILKSIEQNQLKWFGHISRMEKDRQVRKIWEAGTILKRTRGRPKETWNSTVEKILIKQGHTIQTAKKLAQDKKQWRELVNSIEM